ncbi:lysylphosphatidylglycerol synthase transmembrane domain-containing protein [Rubrobacter aplysinae]|uniref:lysylphosphatidylglycerol synthase transmembrane domain-containing protein n=1 Tax=Rubrobacter aplysinae TaxID=909625 RepID=UPI00064C2138|nr:lysylphosphatidylglycerol synthase transmembrane domain-containing protein [Rubrobacter aplysinae]
MLERLKRNLLLAIVLAVAVYLVLFIISGFGDLRAALDGFRWSLVPVILGLVALSYVGRFFRWVYYLKVLGISLPTGINAAIFTAGLSMAISPGKLGEVLKSLFVKQVSGDPVARTAPAVVAERATDGTGMVLWGMLGVLAFNYGPGLLLLFLGMTVLGIAVLRSKRLSVLAERVMSRLPVLDKLAPHVGDFHGASNTLLGARPMIVGTVISFASWGLECLAVYLCAVGVGAGQPFLVVVFIFAVSSLAGALSFVPGGIGVAEAGLAGMFGTVAGLAGGIAVALTLVIRIATLWFATLLGLFGLLLVRRMIGEPTESVESAEAEVAQG